MALLCPKIDLDLEDEGQIYKDAKDTIEYLQDIVKSIEKRALDGEEIPNLKVVDGKKSRTITDDGYKYLAKIYGEDKIYKDIKKPITITELESMIDQEDMAELINKGVIRFKEAKKKVKYEEGDE